MLHFVNMSFVIFVGEIGTITVIFANKIEIIIVTKLLYKVIKIMLIMTIKETVVICVVMA